MIGNVNGKDGTHIQGFVEIEKINKKDNVREVYKNTITNGGKQFLLAKSAASLLAGSGNIFGDVLCSHNLIKQVSTSTSASVNTVARSSRADRDITNVLLNVPDGVYAGLGANTSFINVFDEATMSEAEKVVGFANSNVITAADGKEGTIDFCRGEYMVDPFTVARRWKYDAGQAVGQFNVIAMMPAACIKSPTGDGIKFSQCIDKVNVQYTNYVAMSTGFLIPGVPGYTANNEVLLNFNKDDNNRWKYNIGTGECVAVPENENFFIPTPASSGVIVDMQVIGGYLYVVTLLNVGATTATNITVDVYDINNSMTKVAGFNCTYYDRYEKKITAKLIETPSGLFVSAVSSADATSTNQAKVWKLTVGAGGYATGASSAYTDLSQLGINTPAFEVKTMGFGMYGDNYVMYRCVEMYSDLSDAKALIQGAYIGYKMVGYVFTDLNNPLGSIIDMIPGIRPNEVLFYNTTTAGTLRVGNDAFKSATFAYDKEYDSDDDRVIVMNNNNTTDKYTANVDLTTAGVFLTLDKWWTNVMSLVKLSTPITVTESDVLYVSYGYKIV